MRGREKKSKGAWHWSVISELLTDGGYLQSNIPSLPSCWNFLLIGILFSCDALTQFYYWLMGPKVQVLCHLSFFCCWFKNIGVLMSCNRYLLFIFLHLKSPYQYNNQLTSSLVCKSRMRWHPLKLHGLFPFKMNSF